MTFSMAERERTLHQFTSFQAPAPPWSSLLLRWGASESCEDIIAPPRHHHFVPSRPGRAPASEAITAIIILKKL